MHQRNTAFLCSLYIALPEILLLSTAVYDCAFGLGIHYLDHESESLEVLAVVAQGAVDAGRAEGA